MGSYAFTAPAESQTVTKMNAFWRWGSMVMACLGPSLTAQALDPLRFEGEIRAFEMQPLDQTPGDRSVVFVGSSTIRMWSNLASSFPFLQVVNRGFGGSTMEDLLFYFDRILPPINPALVVVYEGDNDLAAGKSQQTIVTQFEGFLKRMQEALPQSDVAVISVKPSPARQSLIPRVHLLNEALAALCEEQHATFLDLFNPMLDEHGNPYPQLFAADGLHLNQGGYRLWRVTLTPWLQAWHEGSTSVFRQYRLDAGMVWLEWQGPSMLERAPSLRGPWTPVASATHGYHQEPIANPQSFFRLR